MRPVVRVVLVSVVISAACSGGTMATSETDTDAATTTGSTTVTTTVVSDGMSSTTAASSASSTATATTVDDTHGVTDSTDTTGGECHTPETYECDMWAQDCCEGEKCSPWASDGGGWDAWKCVPVAPRPDGIGEPCTVEGGPSSGLDSCEKGAMCWNYDPETNLGVCVGLCEGDLESCTRDPVPCCPAKTGCTTSATGVLYLCLPRCDPLAQDCPSTNDACYPVNVSFQCAPDVSGDMGAVGDPCEFINVCDPGTYCGDPSSYPGCNLDAAGCCTPFCALDMPECVPGTECVPWYDPMDVPPGYEKLGACMIPP